jgi:hypothetical protein
MNETGAKPGPLALPDRASDEGANLTFCREITWEGETPS